MNQLDVFKTQLPAHATGKSKAMEAMASGLAGGGFGNRISLRGSKFRFVQGGVDIGASPNPYVDVVIFALATSVQRIYYEGAYDPNTKTAPTCFSHDGITPSGESAQVQATKCGICPQNVKGSARQGGGKACAYKKRVVVLSPDDLEGAAYALDVNGQSMFGEQQEAQNKFSFKGYFEKLTAHSVAIDAIVTRLSFDDDASVPKLHFTPIRVLTKDEFDLVQARVDDPDVAKMLKDLTNEVEVEVFEQQAHTPQPQPQPIVPPKPITVPPKPIVVEKKGVGGLVSDKPKVTKGFGAAVQAAEATVVVPPKKSVQIDLEALSNFDD